MNTKNLFSTFLGLTTLTILLHLLYKYAGVQIPEDVLMYFRWFSLGVLAWYGIKVKKLTTWILIAMAIGIEIGVDFPAFAKELDIFSKVFMKLIKTVIAPLLFGTLVVGIAGHSDIRQVGRMGLKTLIYFEVVTTLALVVGLLAINISGAGRGIKKETPPPPFIVKMDDLVAKLDTSKGKPTYQLLYNDKPIQTATPKIEQNWKEIVLHTFPENVTKMIHEGQVLQIVVFSILFAIGLTMVDEKHRRVMLDFSESLSEIMFKFTNIIMYFAPFAVGGAIAYTIGDKGLGVAGNLLQLLATLYIALIVFVLAVLLPIALFMKIPIRKFIKAVREPVSLAFATASSEAALPDALKRMEEFGVPRKIVAFVLPTGYSFNLDGTTLYLALAAIFVAQASGTELPIGTQIGIVLTLMLTSKGVAGVPRASLVILAGTIDSFGLEGWPINLILGIDALMDMARTSVNVLGNCLASVVIARWEGELNVTETEID